MQRPSTVLLLGDLRTLPDVGARVVHGGDARPALDGALEAPGVGLVLLDLPGPQLIPALRAAIRAQPDAARVVLLEEGRPFRSELVGLCTAQVHTPTTTPRWRSLVDIHLGGHGLVAPPRDFDSVLPAMADAVRRVLELLDHPEPPLDRAGAAIEADPALAASVLSLANSAYHGIPRRVVSVRDAAVFLGGRSLRLAVLTAWVFDRFEVSAAGLRDRAAERLSIARHLGAISDEAATAALLLDVGSLLLLERHRAWLQSTARLEVGAQRAADTERLGLDRDLLGAHLLARWRLPSAVVAGVGQGRTSFPDPSAGLGPHAVCWLAEAVRLHLQGAPEPDPGWVRTMGLHHRVAELLEMAESRVRAS